MTKILLVEDDKSLREIYGVRLYAEGYDIVSAGDGEEALAMAIKERPALIISDVMMPKISGFDMLDILRSTTETRDIKVIMMTALSSADQRERGESLGADRYLVKSQVGIEDVVRIVHEVLGDSAPNASAPAQAPATPAAPPASPAPAVTVPPRGDTTSAAPSAAPGPRAPAPPAPSNESRLPQPTAPFSTDRPKGLGDRIIQPLERTEDPMAVPIADQIQQELAAHTMATSTPVPEPVSPSPSPDPVTPPAPAPALPDPVSPPPVPPEPATQPQSQAGQVDDPATPMQFTSAPATPDPNAAVAGQQDTSALNDDEAALMAHLSFDQQSSDTDTPAAAEQSPPAGNESSDSSEAQNPEQQPPQPVAN